MKKVQVLFLASTQASDKLKEEFSRVEESLTQESKFRDHFRLDLKLVNSLDDLGRYIREYRPPILHFSGHGHDTGELVVGGQQVPLDFFADLLAEVKNEVRCVILNGCYSERQAGKIAEYIPCAIGTTRDVFALSASDFAAEIYRQLGNGLDVTTAFRSSRDLLSNNTGISPNEFILLPSEQSGEGVIFAPVSLAPAIVNALENAESQATVQDNSGGIVEEHFHDAHLHNVIATPTRRSFKDGTSILEFTVNGEWRCKVHFKRILAGFSDTVWGGNEKYGTFQFDVRIIDQEIAPIEVNVLIGHGDNPNRFAASKVKALIEDKLSRISYSNDVWLQ